MALGTGGRTGGSDCRATRNKKDFIQTSAVPIQGADSTSETGRIASSSGVVLWHQRLLVSATRRVIYLAASLFFATCLTALLAVALELQTRRGARE